MTDNIFEHIKNKINIVDVIGKRLTLKKKGGEWVGICPFHDDHNPSMFVSIRKQLYKCFSCGAGGDVIKFVMEYDKLSLKDAIKTLAELYNINLPFGFSFRQAEKIDRFLDMKTLNAWAADVCHSYLFKAKGGKPGRNYIKSRCLSKEALKVFKIGYIPDSENGFLIQIVTQDDRTRNLPWQKSSLFSSGYRGIRDFFRNRIIFPIHNEKGEVLGFGGRTISNEEPKYLNVRESPWFHKREALYGLKESYAQIIKNKQVYVVEGYLDVIACYEIGIPAVAPLGTAFTPDQLRKLKRYTDKVNLLFDGDTSGKKAAWRSAQDMVALSMDGEVIILPKGVDPFDFIKNNSKEKVNNYFYTMGVNVYSYLVKEVSYNKDKWSPVEKKQALDQLLPIYASISDSMVKKNFGDLIGRAFSLDWEKYQKESRPIAYSTVGTSVRYPNKKFTSSSNDSLKVSSISQNLIKKERSFVLFLCNYPRFLLSARPVIVVEDLEDNLARYIYRKLLNMKENTNFQKILQSFRDDNQEKVAEYVSNQSLKKEYLHTLQSEKVDDNDKDGVEKIEEDFNTRLVILKWEYLKKRQNRLHDRIFIAGDKGDQEEERKLYEEYAALKVEEDNLKKYLEKI